MWCDILAWWWEVDCGSGGLCWTRHWIPCHNTSTLNQTITSKTGNSFPWGTGTQTDTHRWPWTIYISHRLHLTWNIRTNQCPPPPSPIFYRPDVLPAAQPTVSKHWRQSVYKTITANNYFNETTTKQQHSNPFKSLLYRMTRMSWWKLEKNFDARVHWLTLHSACSKSNQ